MTSLYTLGYEGTDVQQFIGTLLDAGVKVVADVRAVPLSRKRGFSKQRLSAQLAEAGIGYVHFVDLGNPKDGRDAAKAGNHKEFHRIFLRHLNSDGAKVALKNLTDLATSRTTCLLCFEREPSECHRTLIASELATRGIKRIDLFADSLSRNVRADSVMRSCNTDQGPPPAE